MERVQRIINPEIRAIDEEKRQVDFIISTEMRDTYGTVFTLDGWNLSRYERNPIVTYMHDDFSSDPDMVIGTSEIRFEEGAMIARLTFEDPEETKNEIADKIWRKVKAGTLRMASVFADVLDGNWGERSKGQDPDTFYFTKQELYSWSIVTHGSNPGALKRSDEISFIEKKKQRVSFDEFDARLFTINKKVK